MRPRSKPEDLSCSSVLNLGRLKVTKETHSLACTELSWGNVR